MPFSAMGEAAAWSPVPMRSRSANSIRHFSRLEALGALGSGKPCSVRLAQVGQRELFETHWVGLPAWRDRTSSYINPDEHVGLRLAALGVDEVQAFRIPIGFNGRTGELLATVMAAVAEDGLSVALSSHVLTELERAAAQRHACEGSGSEI